MKLPEKGPFSVIILYKSYSTLCTGSSASLIYGILTIISSFSTKNIVDYQTLSIILLNQLLYLTYITSVKIKFLSFILILISYSIAPFQIADELKMDENDFSNTVRSAASSDFSDIKDHWATISKVALHDISHSSDFLEYCSA